MCLQCSLHVSVDISVQKRGERGGVIDAVVSKGAGTVHTMLVGTHDVMQADVFCTKVVITPGTMILYHFS